MRSKVYTMSESKDGRSYQYYLASWTDARGVRHRKRFGDLKEAKTFLGLRTVETLNDEVKHAPRMTTLTDDQLRDAENAIALLGDLAGSLSEAVAAYIKPRSVFRIPVRDAIARFLEIKESEGLRPRAQQALRHLLRKFQADREHRILSSVTADEIRQWIGEGTAKKSQRERHFALTGLFRWADRQQTHGQPWILSNPMTGLLPVKLQKHEPEALTADECLRLMRTAESHRNGLFVPYMVLGLFCALRPSEIADLAERKGWGAVNLRTGKLKLTSNKTSSRRVVQIPPNAMEWLSPFKTAGSPVLPGGLPKNLRAIRAAAEISHWPRDVMRHTGISMRLASGKPSSEVADWAGNSPKIIKEHYDALVDDPDEVELFYSIRPGNASGKVVAFSKESTG